MDYEKLHKDTITKLQQMVNSGKITVETACGICADFEPESKDERIRQALKQYFVNSFQNNGVAAICGVHVKDILAYLEEQEQHKKFRDSIQVGDKVTRNEDGVLVNLSQLKRVAKKDEKQGEQNPAWSNVDDEIPYPETLEKAIDLYYYSYGNGEGEFEHLSLERFRDIVHTFVNDYGQKPVWSEEDEKKRKGLIKGLEDRMGFGWTSDTFSREEYIAWLKDLKDRVQPQKEWRQDNVEELTEFENAMMHIGGSFFGEHQGLDPNDTNTIKEQANLLLELVPRQEWSEEDMKMIRTLVAIFEVNYPDGFYKVNPIGTTNMQGIHSSEIIKWLKSLRPQNRWKPRDEQLKALKEACDEHWELDGLDTLYTLYQDLKKLREV